MPTTLFSSISQAIEVSPAALFPLKVVVQLNFSWRKSLYTTNVGGRIKTSYNNLLAGKVGCVSGYSVPKP